MDTVVQVALVVEVMVGIMAAQILQVAAVAAVMD
jgi:hypothetical protein